MKTTTLCNHSDYDWDPTESFQSSDKIYDPVEKPEHYNNHAEGGIECIDYIRQVLGREGFIAYCRGNAIKYQHRAMYKGKPEEDLAKGLQYQQWAVDEIRRKEE